MAKIPGKFVWFEHVTNDIPASQRFYGEVFGWKVQPFDMGGESYPMIAAAGEPIGGWTPPDPKGPARWDSYVSVLDVDATVRAVEAAGGKVLKPAFDVPSVSRMAQVADPTGGAFWVMQSKGTDADDTPATPAGRFHWVELWTTDGAKALAFYVRALGYTHTEMDMGPQGTYRLLNTGEIPRAGIFAMPDAPAGWVPYVAVDDCDKTVERATRLGATAMIPPTDVEGIGRFAVLVDPHGARIGLIKPAAG